MGRKTVMGRVLVTQVFGTVVVTLGLAACGPDHAYIRLSNADLPRDTVYRCDPAPAPCPPNPDPNADTSRFAESASTFDVSGAADGSDACAHGIAEVMVRDLNTPQPYLIFRCRSEDGDIEPMLPPSTGGDATAGGP